MVEAKKKVKISPDMTPGQILRDVRESRGWTVKHISEFTRLSVQCIRDIEADDYTHIAAPVYLFGYFRSYSRALNISEEAIIQSFNALGHKFGQASRKERVVVTPESGQACASVDATNKKRILRWGSLTVVFLLMFLVALWWHNQRVVPVVESGQTTSVANKGTEQKEAPPVAKSSGSTSHPSAAHHASIAIKKSAEATKKEGSTSELLVPTYSVTPVSDNTGD